MTHRPTRRSMSSLGREKTSYVHFALEHVYKAKHQIKAQKKLNHIPVSQIQRLIKVVAHEHV